MRLWRILLLLIALYPLAACSNSDAPFFEEYLAVTEVIKGLGVPWGMTFLSENHLLITEKSGAVKLANVGDGSVKDIAGAPAVNASGQGGLMDVAKSPDYADSGWLYFTYSKPVDGGSATALARARLEGDSLSGWQELFVSNLVSSKAVHFGSRIAFDGDGHLFITHGDRGERDNAQNLSNHGGTVLRLNLDGSVPADNPFVGEQKARAEIWSYGHRNPQGIAYDGAAGRLWVVEHGPRGGDEINLVEPGRNYGWPVISYGREYALPVMVGEGTEKEGMEQPVKVYVPSIAPSSLLLYSGSKYPLWRGDLFLGALALTHLNHLDVGEDGTLSGEVRYLNERGERIRNVVSSPDGTIYLATDSGKILRVDG